MFSFDTEVMAAVWNRLTADNVFRSFWDGALDLDEDDNPRVYPGEAPDEPAMPYVVYDLVKQPDAGGVIWPMGDWRLGFSIYDWATHEERVRKIAARICALLAHAGYATDANLATSVRTYEPIGPNPIDTGSNKVRGLALSFPLRGYNAAEAAAKIAR